MHPSKLSNEELADWLASRSGTDTAERAYDEIARRLRATASNEKLPFLAEDYTNEQLAKAADRIGGIYEIARRLRRLERMEAVLKACERFFIGYERKGRETGVANHFLRMIRQALDAEGEKTSE